MHTQQIVSQVLSECLNKLHAKRSHSLMMSTTGLLKGAYASLSGIARRMPGATALRYRIKSMDRLLGNLAITHSRYELYKRLSQQWLVNVPQPVIVIDWSDITRDQKWQLLRASITLEGRSLTLYEEVHAREAYSNTDVQKQFLKRIAEILPEECKPIVISDAGFRSCFYREVEALGWNWIGRIRHRDMIKREGEPWNYVDLLHAQATMRAQDFGKIEWVKRRPLSCRLILFKQKAQGRYYKNLYGQRSRAHHSLKQAKRENEPWVLATNLEITNMAAQSIVKRYAQRMQIEESFRDTKNIRLGLGLEAARNRSGSRFEILLLLVHLALYVLHILGHWARNQHLEELFQSTNRRKRREISIVTLAKRLLERHWPIFKIPLEEALMALRNLAFFDRETL